MGTTFNDGLQNFNFECQWSHLYYILLLFYRGSLDNETVSVLKEHNVFIC